MAALQNIPTQAEQSLASLYASAASRCWRARFSVHTCSPKVWSGYFWTAWGIAVSNQVRCILHLVTRQLFWES